MLYWETGQHFSDRKTQHQRDIKSGKTTNGFFNHVVILDSEKNWKRRGKKEAVYINAINPTNEMDRKRILNLEKGYILDEIWSEFDQVHRCSTTKKVGGAS